MPPYVISPEQLDKLIQAVALAVQNPAFFRS